MMLEVITENEAYDNFDEYLDAYESEVKVFGHTYLLSQVLRAVDPIVYRDSFITYCNLMAEDKEFLVEGITTDKTVEFIG